MWKKKRRWVKTNSELVKKLSFPQTTPDQRNISIENNFTQSQAKKNHRRHELFGHFSAWVSIKEMKKGGRNHGAAEVKWQIRITER
jgi:hypothetical protein